MPKATKVKTSLWEQMTNHGIKPALNNEINQMHTEITRGEKQLKKKKEEMERCVSPSSIWRIS